MNKSLTAAEIAAALPVMSKRDKLLRFAAIIRTYKYNVGMLNGVEFMSAADQERLVYPAFAIASADPILKDAGLTSGMIAEGKRFFGLTQDELHCFSCDCGGTLSNDQMARRVEAIAARSA